MSIPLDGAPAAATFVALAILVHALSSLLQGWSELELRVRLRRP